MTAGTRASPAEPMTGEPKFRISFAHEINNPLQSLVNLLSLMEVDPGLSEESRRHLILAHEEVRRVSQITRAAMHEKSFATPQKVSVADLVSSVVAFYASRLKAQEILIKVRHRPGVDVLVRKDSLRRAFSNLLLNAADALKAGGMIHVRVSPGHEWSGQERPGVRITFADNGSGICSNDLHRIATPFFTTKGSAGTGIGLSLVQDVVRNHDGALRVRTSTKPGHSGSIFQMFLPAA